MPVTNLYQWKNNTTTPNSSSGLSGYTAGQWSSKKIFTIPSGSTDSGSSGIYYQYKTTGTIGTASDKTATYFNITTEGVSTIAYRACDKLGNCSSYNADRQVKIDSAAPSSPTISGGSETWRNTNRIIWMTAQSTAKSGIDYYQYCINSSNTTSGCSWKNLYNNTNGVSNGIDVAYYHSAYGDLINAFGGNVTSLVNHYNHYGKNEGRKNSDGNWLRTSQNFSETGTKYIFFRAVSKTGVNGNPSNVQKLKIDKKAPTCKTTVGTQETESDMSLADYIYHSIIVQDTKKEDF